MIQQILIKSSIFLTCQSVTAIVVRTGIPPRFRLHPRMVAGDGTISPNAVKLWARAICIAIPHNLSNGGQYPMRVSFFSIFQWCGRWYVHVGMVSHAHFCTCVLYLTRSKSRVYIPPGLTSCCEAKGKLRNQSNVWHHRGAHSFTTTPMHVDFPRRLFVYNIYLSVWF